MSSSELSWDELRRLASAARRANDFTAAKQYFESAIRVGMATDCPANEMAVLLNALADVHLRLNELDQALALAQEGVAYCRANLAVDNPLYATAVMFLARTLELRGEVKAAAEVGKEGQDLYTQSFGQDHPEVSVVRQYVAGLVGRCNK